MSKTLTSTTVPLLPSDILKDVSVTSIAFSPKIDLKSFSSGPDAESPFGVTLPTKISPHLLLHLYIPLQTHQDFLKLLR